MKGKKTGGRQKGALNKTTVEARELAQDLVRSPKYRAKLRERLEAGTAPPSVEVMIWVWAFGRVRDTLAVGGLPEARPVSVRIINETVSSSGGAG